MKKKKPKVLIDAFHLYNALTGIKTYSVLLFEALANDESLSCDYVIYPDWKKATESQFLKGKLGFVKKLIHHGSFLLHKQLFLPAYALIKSADAVISLDFVLPKVKPGRKSFVVIHDVFFWEMKENYPNAWRKYFTGMIHQGIGRQTVLLSTSEYTSEKIRKFIPKQNPIEVVYQSPKLLNNLGEDDSTLQESGLVTGRYFFHVGLLDKRKNLLTLIRAFADYISKRPQSEMKLVLAGERGIGKAQDVYDQILLTIEELRIKQHVVMPGFVSNKALGTLYRNAFAYIFPSFDEGFGIPVLEAFHAGIPVIISDRGALEEVAGEAALVFSADDPGALCKHMISLEDDVVRQRFINLGAERLKSFSKEAFARNFDQVISKHMYL
ncbi:MAG: glycosyltransferase family 4 protein [Roseivirga sp.]|nr:glycosyltransferase family 4 protein [Roseivirga sp.]